MNKRELEQRIQEELSTDDGLDPSGRNDNYDFILDIDKIVVIAEAK